MKSKNNRNILIKEIFNNVIIKTTRRNQMKNLNADCQVFQLTIKLNKKERDLRGGVYEEVKIYNFFTDFEKGFKM